MASNSCPVDQAVFTNRDEVGTFRPITCPTIGCSVAPWARRSIRARLCRNLDDSLAPLVKMTSCRQSSIFGDCLARACLQHGSRSASLGHGANWGLPIASIALAIASRACGKNRRRRRMIEVDALLLFIFGRITAICHLNGRPYIEPNAAAHPPSGPLIQEHRHFHARSYFSRP